MKGILLVLMVLCLSACSQAGASVKESGGDILSQSEKAFMEQESFIRKDRNNFHGNL